ncbi:MAG: 6,7-dimethyl-8-ribityllumazine synthase [Muribaculaceae bacterium]|nr:6,7-dimethyl-8-ribityllumazine synthase [Muribaculaceae bacterium]
MSTSAPISPLPEAGDIKVAIVKALWNGHITGALTDSAVATFKAQGIDNENIDIFDVPGAVELTFAASQLIETSMYDAIIVFGCVVRGGTPHFDYVCQSVTQGITALNADCDTPVIFGVLTVDTEQDALDRCGGPMGDKGAEAAEAAIRMYDFVQRVRDME